MGIYQWPRPNGEITYLRFAFAGRVEGVERGRTLDAGILRAVWMDLAEVEATAARHRSPLILRCIRDYLDGRRYPLELIRHYSTA